MGGVSDGYGDLTRMKTRFDLLPTTTTLAALLSRLPQRCRSCRAVAGVSSDSIVRSLPKYGRTELA